MHRNSWRHVCTQTILIPGTCSVYGEKNALKCRVRSWPFDFRGLGDGAIWLTFSFTVKWWNSTTLQHEQLHLFLVVFICSLFVRRECVCIAFFTRWLNRNIKAASAILWRRLTCSISDNITTDKWGANFICFLISWDRSNFALGERHDCQHRMDNRGNTAIWAPVGRPPR